MSEKIVQLNEEVTKVGLKELVRSSVEETLKGLLEQEAQKLTNAAKYERSENRQGYRSGHYSRKLTTTSRLPWRQAGLRQTSACCRHTVGQQKVYEHEAS